MSDVQVTDNPDESRYEARLDGELAGFAEYRLSDGLITFTHTEVDSSYEGKGVGSGLVRQSLDDVRTKGERDVRLLCPFYRGWIDKHPDYQDLVVSP